MDLYNWIVANKEIIKLFYGLIAAIICLIIVSKAHKLYHLSLYEGIRYFRNAFLFFGIAFIFRYVLGGFIYFDSINPMYNQITMILFEFFILMAGFFLLYSLIWKRIEGESGGSFSSILNFKVLIFYGMALIITIIDYIWSSYYFMFFSMIIIFVLSAIISYSNYIKNGKKGRFLKFYLLAMVLGLVAWILNAFFSAYFDYNKIVLFFVYLLNIVIFLLFLYGIIRITKKSGGQ